MQGGWKTERDFYDLLRDKELVSASAYHFLITAHREHGKLVAVASSGASEQKYQRAVDAFLAKVRKLVEGLGADDMTAALAALSFIPPAVQGMVRRGIQASIEFVARERGLTLTGALDRHRAAFVATLGVSFTNDDKEKGGA